MTPKPPPKPKRFTAEGTTEVVIEAPKPADPIAERYKAASKAFYEERNAEKAIQLAESIRAETEGQSRPERQQAAVLLCDAWVTVRKPKAAVEACARLLNTPPNPELDRPIHYTLATLYRTQLKDCPRAIHHYNQVIVFGRANVADDDIRLFRAKCALEIGDLDLAARDLEILQDKVRQLARPDEFRVLRRRWNALRKNRR